MTKMKLLVMIALGNALVLTAPVRANNSTDPGQKMVCKYRMETGTRFKKKECRTVAEWEAMAEAHRNGLKEMVDRPQIEIRRN